MVKREKDKLDKYLGLKYEIACLWEMRKVEIIPVVIGALEMLTNQFQNRIGKLTGTCNQN